MSLLHNLLSDAAVIRDASQEGENTALRVGGFLVSLIQAIEASIPGLIIDGDVIITQTSESSFTATLKTVDSDGVAGTRAITIPAASISKAGLMSAADKAKLDAMARDIHPVVEVESEEAMEALIAGGEIDDKTMYFVPEE